VSWELGEHCEMRGRTRSKAGHEGKEGYQEERRWREKMEKWSDIWASIVIVFVLKSFVCPRVLKNKSQKNCLSYIHNHSSL